MPSRYINTVAFFLALLGSSISASVTVETNFEDGFGPWQALAQGTWEIQKEENNHVAALVEAGEERPPVRRPHAYILLQNQLFTTFTLTCRIQTLEPDEIIGRDVVIIFGYIDDTHYYYAHLCSDTIGTYHNVIMKVSGETRSIIHNEELPEARLNGSWQDVKLTYSAEGEIAVYLDDMEAPLLTAKDSEYSAGTIGLGSFDDTARFDDIKITGEPPAGISITPPDAENTTTLHYTEYLGIPYEIRISQTLANWDLLSSATPEETTQATQPASIEIPAFYRLTYTYPSLP